ncbi:hypothetical protein ACN47E_001838 [Coniothyrium glycines]
MRLESVVWLVGGFSVLDTVIAEPVPDILDDLRNNAPLEAYGIIKNRKGFGSEPFLPDGEEAVWAPDSQRQEKNETVSVVQDRSLELVGRQTCNAGYWYCSSFGRCCPRTQLCCSYGYCMDPANTCCLGGSCVPGYTCCSASTCAPVGGDCCSNGNYCEAGNICVRLNSNGRIVCCTDTSCTAAVVSGTTTYSRTTTQAAPPAVTRPPAITSRVIIDTTETWYYTVTWWYLSFYYSAFQATSTVTFTTIYTTTTYTTLATDRDDASSRFAVLSRSLTFEAPASATSLRSLYGASISETPTIATGLGFTPGTALPTSSRARSSVASGGIIQPSSNTGGGSTSGASIVMFGWTFAAGALLSGVLMIAL